MCRWSFYRKIVSLATYYPFFSIYLFINLLTNCFMLMI